MLIKVLQIQNPRHHTINYPEIIFDRSDKLIKKSGLKVFFLISHINVPIDQITFTEFLKIAM